MAWADGRLTSAAVRSTLGGRCRVRAEVPLEVHARGRSVKASRPEAQVLEFPTRPGRMYELRAQ